eukprot:gene5674-biopygen4260
MWRRRRHQDSQQACNAPTDDTTIQAVHTRQLTPAGPGGAGETARNTWRSGSHALAVSEGCSRVVFPKAGSEGWLAPKAGWLRRLAGSEGTGAEPHDAGAPARGRVAEAQRHPRAVRHARSAARDGRVRAAGRVWSMGAAWRGSWLVWLHRQGHSCTGKGTTAQARAPLHKARTQLYRQGHSCTDKGIAAQARAQQHRQGHSCTGTRLHRQAPSCTCKDTTAQARAQLHRQGHSCTGKGTAAQARAQLHRKGHSCPGKGTAAQERAQLPERAQLHRKGHNCTGTRTQAGAGALPRALPPIQTQAWVASASSTSPPSPVADKAISPPSVQKTHSAPAPPDTA